MAKAASEDSDLLGHSKYLINLWARTPFVGMLYVPFMSVLDTSLSF